jgi:hypothetical protein
MTIEIWNMGEERRCKIRKTRGEIVEQRRKQST